MQELWYWLEEREAYRKEYAKVWNETGKQEREPSQSRGAVDAILCPVGPGVAPKHGTAKYWAYSSQWNLLDYPGVVFPVDRVDENLDKIDESYDPMNEVDGENWHLCKCNLL